MFISFNSTRAEPTTFGGRVLRWLGRFVFLWMAALLVACLVAVALIVLVLSLARALITGRKSSPASVFRNFKRYAPQGMWPGSVPTANPEEPARPVSPLATGRPLGSQHAAHEVVDVEAREIPRKAP